MTVPANVVEFPAQPGITENDATYSAHDACTAADITYRNLDYWLRCAYIDLDQPDDGVRSLLTGSGNPRRFTAAEVRRLTLLRRLVKAGVRLQVAADLVRRIEANEIPVVLDDGVFLLITESEQPSDEPLDG